MDEPPKRGRGRPKTRPDDLIRLRCDVTPAEAEVIDAARAVTGESIAAFTRRVAVEAAKAVSPPPDVMPSVEAAKPKGKRK